VTGNRDQRSFETPRHVFDKTCLAAAGRTFENHRQSCRVSSFEEFDFAADGQVVRFSCDSIILDCAFRHLINDDSP
jgi:hypothetical protein